LPTGFKTKEEYAKYMRGYRALIKHMQTTLPILLTTPYDKLKSVMEARGVTKNGALTKSINVLHPTDVALMKTLHKIAYAPTVYERDRIVNAFLAELKKKLTEGLEE